jgi:hypothetical protein
MIDTECTGKGKREMKSIFVFLAACISVSAGAQTIVSGTITVTSSPNFASVPITATEEAKSEVAKFYDYRAQHPDGFPSMKDSDPIYWIKGYDGLNKKFGFDATGKIILENMTAEEAAVWLYADRVDAARYSAMAYVHQQAEEKKAELSVPPRRFYFKNTPWDVEQVPDYTLDRPTVLAETYCGLGIIRAVAIAPKKQVSMMHEMLHVVTGCDDEPGMHDLIYKIAPGLVNLLKQNPDLVKYLTQDETKLKPKKTVVMSASISGKPKQ